MRGKAEVSSDIAKPTRLTRTGPSRPADCLVEQPIATKDGDLEAASIRCWMAGCSSS